MQLEKKKKKKKKAFRIIFLIAEIMAETIRIIKIGKNSKKKGCKKLRERFLSRIRRNGDLLNAYGQKKKGNNPGGIPPVHRTQHLRRGEAHGNYPLILFISGRGYITARWGKEPEVVKGRERAPLWRFRTKPSARHSFAEEAKVANYRRRLNASHYDGSYSAPFLLDSRRGVKVYRPLRKSSGFPTLRALFPVPPFPALFFHDLFSTH